MKRKTIRNHKDFFVPDGNFKAVTENFVLKVKPAKILGDARYGLIASKRSFRSAVLRNRVKRLARDWLAFHEDLMLPEFDYVFILYKDIAEADRETGRQSMKKALKRIARMYEKQSKDAEQSL